LKVVVVFGSAVLVAAAALSREEIPDNARAPSRAPVNMDRTIMLLPFCD
jgi:hypothetical protein